MRLLLVGLLCLASCSGAEDHDVGAWDLWSRDGIRVDLHTSVDRLTFTEFGYVRRLVGTVETSGRVMLEDDFTGEVQLRYDDGTEWHGVVSDTPCLDRPFSCRVFSETTKDLRTPRR